MLLSYLQGKAMGLLEIMIGVESLADVKQMVFDILTMRENKEAHVSKMNSGM